MTHSVSLARYVQDQPIRVNLHDSGPITANLDAALALHERVSTLKFSEDALREVNGWASGYFIEEDVMPSLELQATLTPELRVTLLATLTTYQELVLEMKMLEEAVAAEKARVMELLAAEGHESAVIENFKIVTVRPTIAGKLDKQELLNAGVTLDQLARGTTMSKPGKAYPKITCGEF